MTEIANDENAPAVPSLPRRASRSAPSSGGKAAPILLGVVAVALLAGGAGMAWRPLKFSGALDALGGEDANARKQAAQALADMKEYATPRLHTLCTSTSAPQRLKALRAVRALALTGEADFLKTVVETASAPKESPALRAEAISGLGEAAAQSPEALQPLLDLAEKGNPDALEALADLSPSKDPCLKPLLERAQKSLEGSGSPRTKAAYLRSLQGILAACLGAGESAPAAPASQVLQAGLNASLDPDPVVRAEAERLLKLPQGAKRMALAQEGLNSPDAWTRVWSEAVLREATGRGVGYDPFAPEADRRAAAERWKDAKPRS